MKTVYVLLSTYNGEQFLRQQIDSILNQTGVIVQLFIRDDGSQDNTVEILKSYEDLTNVNILFAHNIGWKRSFFALLSMVENNKGSFYAFADQDDVWKPEKLIRGIEKIADTHEPSVYHSNVEEVDEILHHIRTCLPENAVPSSKLPKGYFDSMTFGCTMIFNNQMLELAQAHIPEQATQHDAYIYALGILVGNIFYDSHSYILYRRHSHATTGFSKQTKSGEPTLLMRYRKYKKGPKNNFSIRAQELLKGYSNILDKNQINFLKRIAFYRHNFIYKGYLLFSPLSVATGLRRTLQIKFRVINNTL
ncbi:glycosyltransferase [Pediococcus ethanolidurans]|uniref:glycosyltransferase n=1 Tax=Pediococcus ethanolidurans TaxID=319653 RepID=UPI0021E97BEE|nr:glycosyltransferase [Pediococcus ethanolidurans]MCV3324500.1 glycosyltransferase [Pediococcus ethanolidurans]